MCSGSGSGDFNSRISPFAGRYGSHEKYGFSIARQPSQKIIPLNALPAYERARVSSLEKSNFSVRSTPRDKKYSRNADITAGGSTHAECPMKRAPKESFRPRKEPGGTGSEMNSAYSGSSARPRQSSASSGDLHSCRILRS